MSDQNQTPEPDSAQVTLRLHAARVVASEKQPYLSSALFAMVPVKVAGLGTLASDAKWRLYYDPIKVMEWPVEDLAGVLLHEVGHCIRGHADRFETMGENRKFARLFNIAGDSLINADLREDRIPLPEGAVYIESLNEQQVPATREMSAEQIYQLLREKAEADACSCGDKADQQDQDDATKPEGDEKGQSADGSQGDPNDSGDTQDGYGGAGSPEASQPGSDQGQDQSGSGSGTPDPNCPVHGDGHGHEIVGWDCGSAADGVRRAYETEGDKVDEGIDADRADLIRQQVAVEIVNHARNRGTVPGGYTRWAKELLEPVVDWRKELASLVRRTFAQVAGLRDYTYQRPSRRASSMKLTGQNIVLPAMRQPNPPKVSIVIDTSGSMSDEMLSWAVSETQGVLRALGSSGRSVRLVSCDAKAISTRITKATQVELTGGGGTDMRVGIDEAMAHRDRPDLVVVLTDGFTPWPDAPLKGATLLVALTDEGAGDKVPAWARKVLITRD